MSKPSSQPYLQLSFALGVQDFFLLAFRFKITDNGELSVVPFASEANVALLEEMGFETDNLTDWVGPFHPEELSATISQTYYREGPRAENYQLLLAAGVRSMDRLPARLAAHKARLTVEAPVIPVF